MVRSASPLTVLFVGLTVLSRECQHHYSYLKTVKWKLTIEPLSMPTQKTAKNASWETGHLIWWHYFHFWEWSYEHVEPALASFSCANLPSCWCCNLLLDTSIWNKSLCSSSPLFLLLSSSFARLCFTNICSLGKKIIIPSSFTPKKKKKKRQQEHQNPWC